MDEQVEEEIKEILAQAKRRFREAQAHQIGFAAIYATKAHNTQQRKTGELYIHHPLRVAKQLLALEDRRVDDITIIAALLHDVVEDTNKTLNTIHMQFGRDVANIVDALTKRPLTNKQQQDQEYFTQVQQAAKKDVRVALIKLSDQIDNAQDMSVYSDKRRKERLEHIKDVFIPLANEYELQAFANKLQECYDKHHE